MLIMFVRSDVFNMLNSFNNVVLENALKLSVMWHPCTMYYSKTDIFREMHAF